MTHSAFRTVCLLIAVALASILVGCGSDDLAGAPAGPSATSGDPGGPGGGASGNGGAGSTGGGKSNGMPCDVAAALQTACGDCHTSPPKFGAPMPLTSFDDVHAAAKSDPSRKVYELMAERMTSDDKPMPPKGEISEADKATVLAWLEAGAPQSSESCDDGGGQGGLGVGIDALPCTPTHSITAHALGSAEKYHVPTLAPANQYTCFTFKSPFDGKTQATAWAPIIDDERVIHHWILYKTFVPQIDGGVGPCIMPPGATFVAGWAPGGENMVMPEDVSLELAGPAEYFIMQVHYYNAAGHEDAFDGSGVAFCTTPEPREQTAGVITLGTYAVAIPPHAKGWPAIGHCPSYITGAAMQKPMNIIASFPHMHKLGRTAKTEIFRGGAPDKVDIISDVPNFAFDDQGFYPHDPPIVVDPGDTLRTTCTYDNPEFLPVLFGEGTEDEMCFDFLIGYPIQQLIDRNCMY